MNKVINSPNFWKDKQKAAELSKKAANIEADILKYARLNEEIEEIQGFLEILEDRDEKLKKEIKEKVNRLLMLVKELSLRTYLNTEEDRGDAVMEIMAGVGGRDAQDWVAMLKRMYERYGERKGFSLYILDQSFGESGGPEGRIGIKNIMFEIRGDFAFGFLKNEAGVHRLVRISPFSAQKLRHTSFAQVIVYPLRREEINILIPDSDLKIESFRSSGPGGQYMQKTDSAVRITHLPTKIVVRCQSARSQGQNKKKAMEVLKARLYRIEKQKKAESLKEIKEGIEPAWGRQIRNYILDKRLVKDLRTKVEVVKVEEVLDGNLDQFIHQEIKLKKK